MNDLFRPHLRKFLLVFFDDILVYSRSWKEHIDYLHITFRTLRENQLKVKKSKCVFAAQQVEYLGHLISYEGVRADPNKVEAIQQWPLPNNLKELRGFLGFTGYYRKFVKQYGQIARPLTELLKKNEFKWNDQATAAVNQLKQVMTTSPVLAIPDFSQEFVVETDASGQGIGAVLLQREKSLAFFGKAINGRHLTMSVYEKEMLAIMSVVQKWRHYLLGRHFTIKTDHQSLKYLMDHKISTPAQQMWISKLVGYDYEVQYKKGTENIVADALSRKPNHGVCKAISVVNTELLQEIKDNWKTDPDLSKILQ